MQAEIRTPFTRVPPGVWVVVMVSLLLHAGAVVALMTYSSWRQKPKDLRDKAMITRLLKKGEEKPKNWLPDKAPASVPKPPTPAPVASPSAPKTAATPAKPGKPVDYSRDMKKALSALDTPRDGPQSKETPEGSPDGVEEGDALIAQLGDAYLTQVYKVVKSNYAVPEIISERERLFLQTTVVITLDARGNILDLQFEKRSGNDVFDSSIASAIKKSAPFPPPPKELVDKYASEGIGMNFRAARL